MNPETRARYADLLGASADAAPEAATAAFLSALPGESFLPPAQQVAAVNALAGMSVSTGRAGEAERLLRDEMDAFAAEFWSLAPPERRAAWEDLTRRGADATRLWELEPALDLSSLALADPAAEELAVFIRELVVLPPRSRAIRRNSWLLEQHVAGAKWRAALAVIERDLPALAALEPQLSFSLSPAFARGVFVEGASAATVRVAATKWRVPPAQMPDESLSISKHKAVKIGVLTFFWLIAIIGTLNGLPARLRGLGTKPAVPITLPTVEAPQVPSNADYSVPTDSRLIDTFGSDLQESPEKIDKPFADKKARRAETDKLLADRPTKVSNASSRAFTTAEVAEFERYERKTDKGEISHPPTDYTTWRIAGRPAGVPVAKLPAAERPSYSFDRGQIESCQDYERRKLGSKPECYERWVAAGRPTAPGTYPAPNPVP
jgi:hypothetical protein